MCGNEEFKHCILLLKCIIRCVNFQHAQIIQEAMLLVQVTKVLDSYLHFRLLVILRYLVKLTTPMVYLSKIYQVSCRFSTTDKFVSSLHQCSLGRPKLQMLDTLHMSY